MSGATLNPICTHSGLFASSLRQRFLFLVRYSEPHLNLVVFILGVSTLLGKSAFEMLWLRYINLLFIYLLTCLLTILLKYVVVQIQEASILFFAFSSWRIYMKYSDIFCIYFALHVRHCWARMAVCYMRREFCARTEFQYHTGLVAERHFRTTVVARIQ